MIKIIDSLYLTEKGCCIYNRGFFPVHIRQGDIDGACSIYALMMNLLILKTIRRRKLDDLYNKIKTSPEIEPLFHEFFEKHGLVRDGFYFADLERLIKKSFGKVVTAKNYDEDSEEAKDGFVGLIQKSIDSNQPIMLAIAFQGGEGHAVLAIGYEFDEEGLFNIFCLDPGYDCKPVSYWNMVISLHQYNGIYKHLCITENSRIIKDYAKNYHSAIAISDALLITRK